MPDGTMLPVGVGPFLPAMPYLLQAVLPMRYADPRPMSQPRLDVQANIGESAMPNRPPAQEPPQLNTAPVALSTPPIAAPQTPQPAPRAPITINLPPMPSYQPPPMAAPQAPQPSAPAAPAAPTGPQWWNAQTGRYETLAPSQVNAGYTGISPVAQPGQAGIPGSVDTRPWYVQNPTGRW